MLNRVPKSTRRLPLALILGLLTVTATVRAQPPVAKASAMSRPAGSAEITPIDTGWRASTRDRQALWLLSTRRLPAAAQAGVPKPFTPDVARFEPGRGWIHSTLAELLEAGSHAKSTCLFFHGNDTSALAAAEKGEDLYLQLLGEPRLAAEVQFVAWSWPSEVPGARVRASAQANAQRTNVEGYYLASYLRQLAPDVPVHLCGYCSGARIATGGVHLLGGGELAGMRIAAAGTPRRELHGVLLAPALPDDWLLPGQPHARAVSQFERLVITVNESDPVLRWFPRTWGRGGPNALGRVGLPEPARAGADQGKIVQLDFEPVLPRQHSWQYYRSSPQVIALLRQEMLGTRRAHP
ncbi:MAG: hypothetical protein JNG90_08355 [Planctomycetaceae bacterium]|nr:hypothetical protein [Planctomycetaceae bacterium]